MKSRPAETTNQLPHAREPYTRPKLTLEAPLGTITSGWDDYKECPSDKACEHANDNAAFK